MLIFQGIFCGVKFVGEGWEGLREIMRVAAEPFQKTYVMEIDTSSISPGLAEPSPPQRNSRLHPLSNSPHPPEKKKQKTHDLPRSRVV